MSVRKPLVRKAFVASVAAFLLAAAPALADQAPASNPHDVPEPQGLYQGAPHGYTPSTLKGGTVIDTDALAKLIKSDHPVMIDVADKDRKPPSMAPGMIWLPEHRSIPGSVWLPGAGSGTGDKAFADAFRTRAAALTNGKPATPIVVFCHPDCWASYNAAKRLVDLGYTHVDWYRDGVEGWQNGHDTAVIKPDGAWEASLPKALTQ